MADTYLERSEVYFAEGGTGAIVDALTKEINELKWD